ncbi:Two-component transcriptional response regulator, LuxR family [hydrothermal vent metagenome]|uniref:Two-component transcriptional response regulator, LuxR family n=1 Tax=hydrothermal vent metagenome TaxID=652676 RepID=A0A3B0UGU4_9ZZZZ
MEINILIVDDHKIMREGLRNLLADKANIKVVGEAENGREALALTKKLKPDIIIMDVAMPGLNGMEATKMILNEYHEARIIALSMHSGKQFVTGMFRSGASGYLLKDCAFDELMDAIKAVHSKHTYLSREISDVLVREFVSNMDGTSANTGEVLSTREKEVLQLISEGNSTKIIAEKLFISVKTVETHRQKIMQKLNIFTISELTKYAIRMGFTSLDN